MHAQCPIPVYSSQGRAIIFLLRGQLGRDQSQSQATVTARKMSPLP